MYGEINVGLRFRVGGHQAWEAPKTES